MKKTEIKMLKVKKRFRLLDIDYTEEEKECIKNFKITNFADYISNSNLNKLTTYLKNIGKNDSKQVTLIKKIIKKLLNILLEGYKTKYYLIVIKCMDKNTISMPTWHVDRNIFDNNSEIKFVTTLKGPSTLFIDDDESTKVYHKLQKKEFNDQQKIEDNKEKIQKIMDLIDKYAEIYRKVLSTAKIVQPTNNQCVIFNYTTVHAEPIINEPRFFISIIPILK
jgi:hypothetical protein